jgi:hypothetical protein
LLICLLLLLLLWLLLRLLLPLMLMLLQLPPPGLQHCWVSCGPHDKAAGQHGPPGQTVLLPRHGAKAALCRLPHQQA